MAEPNFEEGSLAKHLFALLESGRGADVTLVVGESELVAHSHILAARSPVFAAMLTHDTEETRSRRILIADVREDVLKEMLCFMYTDTAPQLDSVAAELLSASDKYDLPLLKKRCEEAVARGLTVDNAAAAAVLAELHSCQLLKAAAIGFVRAHLVEVLATEGWINAMRHNVEATAQICRQLATATSSPLPTKRILSEGEKENLTKKLLNAASDGHVGEIRRLLDVGAPVNATDDSGNTALHKAAEKSHAAAVKILIEAGADVNTRNSSLITPLHRAALCQTDVHITWLLLAAGADTSAQDNHGDTPLHDAASKDSEHVKALLLAGADRYIRNTSEKTPRSKASSSNVIGLFDAY